MKLDFELRKEELMHIERKEIRENENLLKTMEEKAREDAIERLRLEIELEAIRSTKRKLQKVSESGLLDLDAENIRLVAKMEKLKAVKKNLNRGSNVGDLNL